jgi:hypothetical protein
MKLSTTSFLLGWIAGISMAGSWVFGHLNNWNNPGPVFGILFAGIVLVFGTILHIAYEMEQ